MGNPDGGWGLNVGVGALGWEYLVAARQHSSSSLWFVEQYYASLFALTSPSRGWRCASAEWNGYFPLCMCMVNIERLVDAVMSSWRFITIRLFLLLLFLVGLNGTHTILLVFLYFRLVLSGLLIGLLATSDFDIIIGDVKIETFLLVGIGFWRVGRTDLYDTSTITFYDKR